MKTKLNKQAVIDEIENAIPDFLLNDFQRGKETGLSYALELVNQLDEPKNLLYRNLWQIFMRLLKMSLSDWDYRLS